MNNLREIGRSCLMLFEILSELADGSQIKFWFFGRRRSSSPYILSGGTVSSISALSSFVVAKPSLSEWLERGTSHFQGILSLPAQVKEVNRLGSEDARHHHALAVCHEAYIRTSQVCHSNGRKVSHIFGDHGLPNWEKLQGPTLTLLLSLGEMRCKNGEASYASIPTHVWGNMKLQTNVNINNVYIYMYIFIRIYCIHRYMYIYTYTYI